MKKICVVYRNRRNTAAIAWLDNCLKRVYEDYVDVEDCFMDELTDEDHLSADAFLVISSSLLPKLRRHTASLKNVVTMTRSVKRVSSCDPRHSDRHGCAAGQRHDAELGGDGTHVL